MELELFADYYQIHLFDDGFVSDLGDAWTDEAVLDGLAVATDAMAVGTTVNVNVAVTLEVLGLAPEDDSAEFDHVVEGSLQVPSGQLIVHGLHRLRAGGCPVRDGGGTGCVRRLSNLAEAERLDMDSDDDPATMERLRLQVWPAPLDDPVVIKRWKPLEA